MDSGKHSALKQSSDGSFELVVTDDVVEETAAPAPEQTETVAAAQAERPGGMLKWVVLAAVVIALGGVSVFGYMALGSDDGDADGEEATGFKPYTGDGDGSGDGEPARAAIRPVDPVRPSQPARRVVDDDEIVESEIEMVEETDPNWNVDENGEEIVESEAIPPDFMDQVAQTDDEPEIEEGRDGTKFASPKVLKNIRQQINRDIEIRKSLPNIKLNARPANLNTRINPGNAIGPTGADDITVIEDESLEELPENDE